MVIGVPKEIMEYEYRVGLVPAGVKQLVEDGHRVLIEKGAGLGSNIPDGAYTRVGGEIVQRAADVYRRAELVARVKEPPESQWRYLRSGQGVFCFFHFAANPPLLKAMLKLKVTSIAYETVEDFEGRLPLLTPMSEVAGRMAVQEGAKCLERPMEGRGILLGGVPGVSPARVVVLGGGVVGSNAARVAAGLGARVVIMDINLDRLRYLADVMPANVSTEMSDWLAVESAVAQADLVIGAALRHGARAPILVTHRMLKKMRKGSVVVDVAIDQGGCTEGSRPTTHGHPTFCLNGVVYYGVTNMPGAVAGTSTYALTNATFPYVRRIAEEGIKEAAVNHRPIAMGINAAGGRVTYPALAEIVKTRAVPIEAALKGA
ncbi:MAG: alanine dehydrogenase [Candidatus Omnitrophica bacterium]|nr:alanine dehydrogenase [Candidatus Omnitrophota bacterium]